MKALITGVRGQDGSFLADFLLGKGYGVHGLVRRSATPESQSKIGHIVDSEYMNSQFFLHYGDLGDYASVRRIIEQVRPDEIYNLGAMSNVPDSFHNPQLAIQINGNGLINVLEAVKSIDQYIKVYQASTTEIFGKTTSPQNEDTLMNPQSPYAWGKWVAHKAAELYREAYGMFVVSGILGNHDSERRGHEFVTRKITSSAARIYYGKQDKLYLGNLEPKRDFGYAPEYMEAVYAMMQLPDPDTFVIGTGENHSIQEFLDKVFAYVGLDPNEYVEHKAEFMRPKDVHNLIIDYKKATGAFQYEAKITFEEIWKRMIKHDLEVERGTDYDR